MIRLRRFDKAFNICFRSYELRVVVQKRASGCYFLSNLVVVLNQFFKAILHEIYPRLFKLLDVGQVGFVGNIHLLGDAIEMNYRRIVGLKSDFSLIFDFDSFVAHLLYLFNRNLATFHLKHPFFNFNFVLNGLIFEGEVARF